MKKIRVLIADDHAILRAGLHILINSQPDMEVVGEAADSHEAEQQVHAALPDVLLLDWTMPGGSSLPMIGRLRREHPGVRVLVLTMHDDPAYLRAALAAGALGYVVKTAAETELLSAIRAVHQHRVFVDLQMTDSLVQTVLGGTGAPLPAGKTGRGTELSQRERQVLELLAQGHTNRQVADRLYLSAKTVETYRARIADKLGLRSRADFIRYAVEMGLLGPDKYLVPHQP
jgi:DNA-binding NarL/FixJ family response regulator